MWLIKTCSLQLLLIEVVGELWDRALGAMGCGSLQCCNVLLLADPILGKSHGRQAPPNTATGSNLGMVVGPGPTVPGWGGSPWQSHGAHLQPAAQVLSGLGLCSRLDSRQPGTISRRWGRPRLDFGSSRCRNAVILTCKNETQHWGKDSHRWIPAYLLGWIIPASFPSCHIVLKWWHFILLDIITAFVVVVKSLFSYLKITKTL